ncbi:MAG TPA: DUF5666 domain-containing protein [Pyrinomonadaceae bacterium]|jgi:hypothetical protein|nr:DUF5666 domain-containing protein [Pyrinomonadaceae bacterium]
MKKILTACVISALAFMAGIDAYGQGGDAQAANQADARPAQNRIIGAVTAIDASAMQVTIKTDDGAIVQVALNDRTSILRVPPGETDPAKAVKIGLADIAVGDRLFARGTVAADGKSVVARQVVITNGAAVAQQQERDREAERRRRVVGRITALDPATREITLLARSREGGETITISAPASVRLLRYAPDSLNPRDAKPGSFADLKIGDQIRAQGERSADGKRFTAEEIISGAFQRVGGTVTSINAAANEITVRNEQTGKSLTITVGGKSMLRRLTPEVAASLGERGRRRTDRRSSAVAATEQEQGAQGRAQEGNGGGGAGGADGRGRWQRTGGRNFQEMIESLPAITIADLKKGDVVLVNGTIATADASRVTAITLLTGEAEFLNRLQRFQGGPNRDRQMNPGLPGDVLGTGTGNNRDQP